MTRRRQIHPADTCSPTYLVRCLTEQAVNDYGCTRRCALRLVKRALTADAVRAAVLEQVGEYLADEAAESIRDTQTT